MNTEELKLKYSLQKMYVILVDSKESKFKAGDIITNGKETKIATHSSGFLNFKNWGYKKRDLIFASQSFINLGELLIKPNIVEGKIVDFDGSEIKEANMSYSEGPEALKVFASTGHEYYNLAKIKPEFIDLYFKREGGIKVTNVVVHRYTKDRYAPQKNEDGTVNTRPVFRKFKRFKGGKK